MKRPTEAKFLGFGHWMPWSMSVVGFIKRRLDVHEFERGATACLRDQRHGKKIATVVPWELCDVMESRSMGKQWHCGGSVLCTWGTSLLCRDGCLMSRTKFGSNTMLNILATRCVILYCI